MIFRDTYLGRRGILLLLALSFPVQLASVTPLLPLEFLCIAKNLSLFSGFVGTQLSRCKLMLLVSSGGRKKIKRAVAIELTLVK